MTSVGSQPSPQQTGYPQPHKKSFFFKLLSKFRSLSHPVAMDDDGDLESQVDPLQDWWHQKFTLSSNRMERYRIFQEMTSFDLVNACISIYSEEATQSDYDRQKLIWVESKHEHMISAGNECLRNVQAEDRTVPLCWRTCRDGG